MSSLHATRPVAHEQPGAEMFAGVQPRAAAPSLRPYQERDLAKVRAAMRTHRAVLLTQPCGSGKGFLAAHIVHSAVARGKRVIFLVNRRALVIDFSQRLDRLGVDHGVIMGNDPRRKAWLSTHVASIDTLSRREVVPHADILIIDEARFACSPMWQKTVAKYPNAKILGLDATPIRTDGRGLGEMFDAMVVGPTVAELIQNKFLVPSVTFSGMRPDTSNVSTVGGDYKNDALAAVSDTNQLVGDIVDNWKTISHGRKTVAFGVNKKHALHIAEQFRLQGVQFAYVDDKTPDNERQHIWNDFDYGHLVGISSVGVIGFGWDHPVCSTVIKARKTQSLSVDQQQSGRGSRIYPGKTEFFVLDHAGNYLIHGFYEDPREYSLEGNGIKESEDPEPPLHECGKCRQVWSGWNNKCPICGSIVEPRAAAEIEVVEGTLQEVLPRVVCNACKREMPGCRAGDLCVGEVDGLLPYGACPGVAQRAYQIKELSKNPKIAELQRIAEERGYRAGWLHFQIQKLGLARGAR